MAVYAIDRTGSVPRATRNGQPLFVLGLYDQYNDAGNPVDDVNAQKALLAACRATHYLNFTHGANGWASRALGALSPLGYDGFETCNAFASTPITLDTRVPQFDFVANPLVSGVPFRQAFAAQPAAGGIYFADEVKVALLPDLLKWGAIFNADCPGLPLLTALIPSGPLMPQSTGYAEKVDDTGNVYKWARDLAGLANVWLAMDPYPVVREETTGPFGYPHWGVADCIAHTVAAAKQHGMVPLVVLQYFFFTSVARWITPQEMRLHATMAMVERAQGAFWWQIGRGLGPADDPPEVRAVLEGALAGITTFLRTVSPLVLSEPEPGLTVSTAVADARAYRIAILDKVFKGTAPFLYFGPGGAGGGLPYQAEQRALRAGDLAWSPMLGQGGPVRTAMWREPGTGRRLVAAYNYDPEALASPVTFTVPFQVARVDVMFEGRTVTPSGASWTDTFGGSGSLQQATPAAHIYWVTPAGEVPPLPPAPHTTVITIDGTDYKVGVK